MHDCPDGVPAERRFSERAARRVECHVYDADGFLLGPGTTRNISEGGMLIEVEIEGEPPVVADEIEIGLGDRAITARVVRCGPFGRGRCLMGVEFTSLHEMVAAA
jgi:hypothetical protein